MKKCKKKNVPLFKGNCYPCHKGREEHKRQHNCMCYECATGKNEDISPNFLACFIHGERARRKGEPEPLMESE